MIPVAANDVAFSIHAVLLTALTLIQIAIYEVSSTCTLVLIHLLHFLLYNFVTDRISFIYTQRGSQKVSKISIGIIVAVWLAAAVCFFVALSNHSWLWLISVFK